MRHSRVLIVNDDPGIIKLLQASFRDEDYEPSVAMDGAEALQIVQKDMPDLIVMDMKLPKIDGLEVCRQLREWSQVPIIMLSGDATTETKVNCFDTGADDYIIKPFSVDELMARVRALLRRIKTGRSTPTQSVFSVGELQINFAERRVTLAENEIRCTPTEYSLLKELVVNVGKVLTHTQLLKSLWGQEYSSETEYLRVFVNRLRAKIEPDPANPRYILTMPGVGYMFNRRKPEPTQVLSASVVNERRL